MKVAWLMALALAAFPAMAGKLIAVDGSPNARCGTADCGMYDEWRVEGLPGLRVVMSGYEDGVDTTLYRVTGNGRYVRLVDIVPLARDRQGRDWWGYADVVQVLPLRVRSGKVQVLATFDHDQILDGDHCPPDWQRRWPAVLFRGEKARWNARQARYRYVWTDLDALVSLASRSPDDPVMRVVKTCR